MSNGSAKKSVAGSISFQEVVKLCEDITKQCKTKKNKQDVLKRFIAAWRKRCKEMHGDVQPPAETFFPFMRLIIPEADRQRPVYGIKENTLARIYIELLPLSPTSNAGETMLNFKKSFAKNSEDRDFAAVAYEVLKDRILPSGGLTVEEVNEHLDALALANIAKGEEKKDKTKEIMMDFLRKLSPLEQKWLIRIMLKDLKLGMSSDTIMNIFHPDGKQLYDNSMNISTVCTNLHDPNVRIIEMEVELFSVVRSMLAEKWNQQSLASALKAGPLIAEVKYDGDRCQIHKRGNEFRYFSRLGSDNTSLLGSNAKEGFLTPFIADCFDPEVESFIIDGELCAYNYKLDTIVSKMESNTIKKLNGDATFQQCFVAFDILFYKDKAITSLPLRERLAKLNTLFREEKGRLFRSPLREVKTPEECYACLNEATDRNEEGIMLKDPNSVYKPAGRSGAGWWKFKATDADNRLGDTLDVIIIGGYLGKRQGISHFLVAVAEPPEKEGDPPTHFYPLCRVGTGYSNKDLTDIGEKLDKHWKDISGSASYPSHFKMPAGDKKVDYWIKACDSMILEIKANEILESDKYSSGYTLRFPRVVQPRYDKPWYDCMTLKQLADFKLTCNGMMGAKNVTADDFNQSAPKRQKFLKKILLNLPSHYAPASLVGVKTDGTILNAKKFYVPNGDKSHSKQELEKIIIENGGRVVQHTGPDTFCIIASKMIAHITNIVNSEPVDVVRPSWLFRCVEAGKYVAWHPKDLLWKKSGTEMLLRTAYDEFGDSYTDDIELEDFQRILREMKLHNKISGVTVENIAEFEQEYFDEIPLIGLFRLVNVYVDKTWNGSTFPSGHPLMKTIEQVIVNHGGRVSLDPNDESVTHVIFHSSGPIEHLEELKAVNRNRTGKFHLVTENWVMESVNRMELEEERGYFPRLLADKNALPKPTLADLF